MMLETAVAPRSVRHGTAIAMYLLIALSYVVNGMDRSVFANLVKSITTEFHLSLAQGGLLSTVYALGFGVTGIFAGYLLDRAARKFRQWLPVRQRVRDDPEGRPGRPCGQGIRRRLQRALPGRRVRSSTFMCRTRWRTGRSCTGGQTGRPRRSPRRQCRRPYIPSVPAWQPRSRTRPQIYALQDSPSSSMGSFGALSRALLPAFCELAIGDDLPNSPR
jgi:hypothetical protein